ncbi:hypothetical protein [Peribacillus muralis]|uniref:hypothetical protein n=1 Tax=Peribacillus muralis TaxID=264697 RepID=UPI00366D4383
MRVYLRHRRQSRGGSRTARGKQMPAVQWNGHSPNPQTKGNGGFTLLFKQSGMKQKARDSCRNCG